jgi:hypothetical protein
MKKLVLCVGLLASASAFGVKQIGFTVEEKESIKLACVIKGKNTPEFCDCFIDGLDNIMRQAGKNANDEASEKEVQQIKVLIPKCQKLDLTT